MDVEKGEMAVLLLFHGELDGGVLLVEVCEEFLELVLTVGPYYECVVHIA